MQSGDKSADKFLNAIAIVLCCRVMPSFICQRDARGQFAYKLVRSVLLVETSYLLGKSNSMKHLIDFLFPLGALLLPGLTLGKEQSMVLQKYQEAIHKYIMTGHENGWKPCDILSDRFSFEGTPHVSMELEKIKRLDTRSAFASSNCLLVIYHVGDKASISALLDFGWATISHLRLALVMKMDPGITLEMSTNITKLPFLVAAESNHGKTKFLCPVIGETEPRLDLDMCKPSFVSYKNKLFRVGIMGHNPYFVNSNLGHDGIDIRLLTMLEERLKFNFELIVPPSFLDSVDMVSSIPCYNNCKLSLN